MDSKTIKNSLKQAKEAIKNKDIDSALSLCKAVLKDDRNNYIALVLLGAAFQDSDQKAQAPNAYRKAIEISPNQILAWQGLAAFYEKDACNESAEHLLPVYQRLLHLESETTKWCDLILKVQTAATMIKGGDNYVAEILNNHINTEDINKREALRKLVIHHLSQANEIPEENLQLYEKILNDPDTKFESDHCQVYFKLLYNLNKPLEILKIVDNKINNCYKDAGIMEWLCKVCAEQFVDNRLSVVEWCSKLPEYYSAVLESNKNNVLALMAQGVHHMSQRNYLEARGCLQHCISLSSGLFHGLCLLAETQLCLLCPQLAMQLAEIAASLRPEHIVPRVLRIKALALSDQPGNWQLAIDQANGILAEDKSELAAEGLCQALQQMGQWRELQSAVSHLSHAPSLAALLQLEAEARLEGKELLTSLAQHTPDCPEAWFRLGELYMATNDHDKACTAFLRCAKQSPHWFTAYMQLGSIYSCSASTLDKARRCYQRALLLNPDHTPTQAALSDTYRALGDTVSNLELLQGIADTVEGRWAWPRLGLLYADLGDTSAAIHCLRAALNTDPTQSHLWETLADTYLARGANGSALKSYQRVLELKPESFYSALQIATIKQITDLPEESLLEFRELVSKQPNSILAWKGLCETCLCLAKGLIQRRLLGLARDRLQEGLDALSSALQLRPGLACLWKLAGECLTLAGSLPSACNQLTIHPVIHAKTQSKQQVHTLQGCQLLQLGERCLCGCLKLMRDTTSCALVWHDLALNYRLQVQYVDQTAASAALCNNALAAARRSVTLDPSTWQHWNQLGIIAALPNMKKYALSQHAFIKATMVEETVAVPWSNLGCLYLGLGQLKLANSAFSAAQRIDSEYCPSWIGQALIAEQVQNEETMDLFRHTTQLGYHSQSCLGYAQWVCQTLRLSSAKTDPHYVYSIERMHAVPVAIDALTWATDEQEQDVCGLNMLGCLLERAGLYRSSVGVLSRAVDHCPPEQKDVVLANFARVLLSADKVDDAIQVYKAITKADIHSQCGLALALYKGKQYQEAYEAYQAALEWWAADDAVKAQLHVALAAVAYRLVGPDQAKALLLQGNQLKPQSVHGLFATCALGMLNSDLQLSKAVLRELLPYQNQAEYATDVALFQAYTKFIQGEIKASVFCMSEAVHRQPALAALWLHLALLIMNKQSLSADPPNKVAVAAKCARTAMTLGRTCMDVSKVLAVVSLSQLLGGNMKQALSASQHAVHLYPSVGESWAVLAASCHADGLPPTTLRPLISHARQHIHLERPLAKWMSNFERKIALQTS